MLKISIPRFKFWKSAPAGETSYPNLEDGKEGLPIPERYGVLTNVEPIVDTTTGRYKIMRRGMKAIDAVRDGSVTLVSGTDYTEDLVNGEFSILNTPLLTGGATYYFILESDYAINGTDYLRYGTDAHGHYGHYYYDIDGAGAWTEVPNKNFEFKLYGRTALGGRDTLLIDAINWSGWNASIHLRDAAARTRVAQEFVMPAGGPYYLSRILLYYAHPAGTPAAGRITKMQIVSAYSPAEVPVGTKSLRLESSGNSKAKWAQRAGGSNAVRCDIQALPNADTSLMENIADVLEDIYVNVLGGSAAGINAADLAAIKAARAQEVAHSMTEEREFQQALEIFEAGQLFKVLPSLGSDFAVRFFASGEPSGTPHLKMAHVKNLTMQRVWTNVYQRATVKYRQDPSTGEWLAAEASSDIARYLYNRQNIFELETALKDQADAVQLAKDYLGTDAGSSRRVHLQYPTRIAEFDVLAGYGDLLIPTMKVKLTLPRADYAGGVLNGVLFRVLEVKKNPMNGESHIVATLDSLTY